MQCLEKKSMVDYRNHHQGVIKKDPDWQFNLAHIDRFKVWLHLKCHLNLEP